MRSGKREGEKREGGPGWLNLGGGLKGNNLF